MKKRKRWPLNKAYFWQQAPFFRILLPFAAGILCYDKGWLPLSGGMLMLLSFGAMCGYGFFAYIRRHSDRNRVASFTLLNILLLFAGTTCAWYSDIRNNSIWFGKALNDGNGYVAQITDNPADKEHSWKIPVSVCGVVNDKGISPATGNAFIYLRKEQVALSLHKGDTIMLPAEWQPIKNAGNPFEFDYAAYCRRNGLVYQQFLSVDDLQKYGANDPGESSFTERTHDWCMLQFDRYIPAHTARGLIQAMILGDEVNLDPDLRQSYAETGIIHIIAISGGNVAVFFIIISFLLLWLRHKQYLWIKYVIALPLVWFYVLMAGASPSAMRAAVMFSLLALGIVFDKNNNSLNQLFATAFLLLVAQPMWLFSLGFQLSFVAVLSLILFYGPVYRLVSTVSKPLRLLWGTVAASIAAEILVAPLVIYYFHTFPLLFVVANAAAYIFMSVVLVLGIAVILLSFIPLIASLLGSVIVWLVSIFGSIVAALQQLSPQSFRFLLLTSVELILVYLIIAGFASFVLRKKKVGLFTSVSAACILLCSFCAREITRLHQQHLIVYNTPGTNHTEFIRGDNYILLNDDTTNSKKMVYAATPAHATWQAWEKEKSSENKIFMINDRKVLILNNCINAEEHFPVDVLIMNTGAVTDPQRLRRIFSPSMIVLGNKYTRHEQQRWIKACSTAGIAVHAVARDGAFVMN